jgi:signal transduction histidine kinase
MDRQPLLDADTLTPQDVRELEALAEVLWTQRYEIAAEWSRRLMELLPGAFPGARVTREQVTEVNAEFLALIFENIRKKNLPRLYERYYAETRRLIEADLQRAPANTISLAGLYLSARLSLSVIHERLGAGAQAQALAYTKLTAQLMMLVGRAYSDSREAYLQRTFEQINTLSHELRTPITHVFSYLEMLHAGDFGPISPRQAAVLSDLMREADDLLLLLTGTLDLSRIDTGHIQVRHESFLLDDVFADVVNGTPHAPDAVRWKVSADLPELKSDRIKVKQILSNLLRNALHYGGGSPVFMTAAVARPGFVEVSVLDHGPGIKPDDLRIIFNFLERGDAAGLARDGYGIGLHVVRRLVRLLGGRIEVDSVLGQGTCFRFTLPLQPVGNTGA